MEASSAAPPLELEPPAGPLARDFLCGACGYGIAPRAALPEFCPMCRSSAWIPHLRRWADRAAGPDAA